MRFTAQRGTLDKSVDWGSGSFETWLFEKFQISNYRNIDYSKRTWRSNYLKCRIFEKAEDQVTRNIYYSKTSHRVKRLLGMARAFVWSRNQSIAPFFFLTCHLRSWTSIFLNKWWWWQVKTKQLRSMSSSYFHHLRFTWMKGYAPNKEDEKNSEWKLLVTKGSQTGTADRIPLHFTTILKVLVSIWSVGCSQCYWMGMLRLCSPFSRNNLLKTF